MNEGALDRTGATILEATGEPDARRFRLRFDGHERLTDFHRRCAGRDIDLGLQGVHDPDVRGPPGGADG